MHDLEMRLAELEHAGLRRRLRLISGPQGPRVLLDGRPVLLLCSNNYLGLADHLRVREAAAEAAMRWGAGAGASRLVSGSMTVHRRLEERLAAFKGTESCVLFGSGYLANVGTIGALAGHGDVIFSDELNHASIIDACRLSSAQTVVYRHRDVEHLAWCMRRHGSERHDGEGSRLIVTDSVFSMDGHVAPLAELAELADYWDATLMVDEAHATGILGPGGRGAVAAAGLEGGVDVIVGTLGKALGSYGAYVCAQQATVDYLLSSARPLIFSTAPPPPAVAAGLAALDLLEERPQRIERVRLAARALRAALADEGFAVERSDMHIVPLVLGEERAAMRISQAAIERGVFAQAIRPPSVPRGTTRLRMTVMASHTAQELRGAARVLARAVREQGFDLSGVGEPELEPLPYADEAAVAHAAAEGARDGAPALRVIDFQAAEEASAKRPGRRAAHAWADWEEAEPSRHDLSGESLPETAAFDVEALMDGGAPPGAATPAPAGPFPQGTGAAQAGEPRPGRSVLFDLEREGGLREAA
jgi:8-amino-7-oxononanoate synthase